MPRISIIVEFNPKPGSYDAFDALIREHAGLTKAEEAGCLSFDVFHPLHADGSVDTARIMLVEIYRDMEAVNAHRANPRLSKVAAAYKDLIDGRKLALCEQVD
jgi:quinol monooxygenase YgiN